MRQKFKKAEGAERAIPPNSNSAESKKSGNYSRRFRNSVAHTEARENYEAEKGAQLDAAHDRAEMSERRKPSEQLSRLDKKFGEGIGAAKERAKLKARIASGDKSRFTLAEEKAKKEEAKEKKAKKKVGVVEE